MEDNKQKYSYKDSGNVQRTIDLGDADFKFVQQDKNIHDVQFKTKPTTFLKDAFKRFCKNKSSVVAASILGVLLILSFVLPVTIPYDTDSPHTEARFLEPKLFEAGTGFWDGTKRITDAVCSTQKVTEETNANSNYKNTVGDNYYYPSGYSYRAVLNLTEAVLGYTTQASENTIGGYVKLINTSLLSEETSSHYESYSNPYSLSNDLSFTFTVGTFEDEKEEFEVGDYKVYVKLTSESTVKTYTLLESSAPSKEEEQTINVKEKLIEAGAEVKDYDSINFGFELLPNETSNSALFIKSATITSSDATENTKFSALSFESGNNVILRYNNTSDKGNVTNLWDDLTDDRSYTSYSLYHGEARLCSFTLDTYENMLGVKENFDIGESMMRRYMGQSLAMDGETYIDDDSLPVLCEYDFKVGPSSFKRLSEDCPIISVEQQTTDTVVGGIKVVVLKCTIYQYIYSGYGSKMPKFVLGTDKFGKDMLKITFSGLRTSLLLGLFTFVICFTFGLVLGAIEGYYGGWVDMVLQRLTEILSGIPWIVLMTLIILLMGSNFWTFALALCLTGWISTSNLTRTQFYRFKGREYILASRTLGARDSRLIFKHILPNSMGTIITSSVLMIPSVIFSEATISYLGLGLKNMNSLGIILSDNQANLQYYPYTLILPAVIIALLMICFNLFGNGLRDAFNPSLKGSD